jgi:hypothetical protein
MPRKKSDGTNKPVGTEKKKRAVKRHMAKKGTKWATWLELDGKPIEGSEQQHKTMAEAAKWVRGKSLN